MLHSIFFSFHKEKLIQAKRLTRLERIILFVVPVSICTFYYYIDKLQTTENDFIQTKITSHQRLNHKYHYTHCQTHTHTHTYIYIYIYILYSSKWRCILYNCYNTTMSVMYTNTMREYVERYIYYWSTTYLQPGWCFPSIIGGYIHLFLGARI